MVLRMQQPIGLRTRPGSRSIARCAVRLGCAAGVQHRGLGASRRAIVIPRAASPEIETPVEVSRPELH